MNFVSAYLHVEGCVKIIHNDVYIFFASISYKDVTLLNLRKLACFCLECMDDNPNFCENKSQV